MRYSLRAHCHQQATGNLLPQVRQQKGHYPVIGLCHGERLEQWIRKQGRHIIPERW